MQDLNLTPATRAVLTALAELGQGNVHELAEKSGKARSTVDKAIKTLADAGLIVLVDTGADPAEGTPARWTLSETAAAALEAADLGDEADAGLDESDDEDLDVADESGADDTEQTDGDEADDDDADDTGAAAKDGAPKAAVTPTRPGDRKVMAIKGVLAECGDDGATLATIVAESGIGDATVTRLLAAMEQADAARRLPPEQGKPERWIAGPTKASEVDPNPEPPRCALCFQVIRGVTSTPAAVAAVQSLIRPDGTLHIVGPDGKPHYIKLPTRPAARPINGSPSTVSRPSGVTVNADGSQPFGRGELEKLSIGVLTENPGKPMSAQDIASAISAKLNGRVVSPGAVRNNCTKAAAAGTGGIQLFSDQPLMFVFPKPKAKEDTAETEPGDEQPDGDDGAASGGEDPSGDLHSNDAEQS